MTCDTVPRALQRVAFCNLSMGRHALTLVQRKRKASEAHESRIQSALKSYYAEHPPDPPLEPALGHRARSSTSIAQEHGVSATTLWRREHGGRSVHDAHVAAQLLTPAEEKILLQLCKTLALHFLPLSHQLLQDKANAILSVRAGGSVRQVGARWSYRFMVRHSDEIAMYWSSGLKNARGLALNPTNIREYFEILTEIDRDHHIKPRFKYAMDESPILLGMESTARVIGPAGQKLQHKLQDGNRESVSFVVTICADGSVPFPPTVIFSGQNYLKRWSSHNVLDAA